MKSIFTKKTNLMKIKLLFIFALLVTLSIGAQTTYTSGDVTYTISSNEAVVSGLSSSGSGKTSIVVPGRINHNRTWYNTIIGASAFQDKNLVKVDIQYGCREIQLAAFYNCTSLEAVHIPSSVISFGAKIFYNCTKLKHLNLSQNTVPASLGDNSLYNVPKSCNVYVYQHMYNYFLNSEFWKQYNIKIGAYDIYFNKLAYYVRDRANSRVGVVPMIWDYDYHSSAFLSGSVEIPPTIYFNNITYQVDRIFERAFDGNTAITSVTIPNTVQTFNGLSGAYSLAGQNAYDRGAQFRGCTGLKTISLPPNLEMIPTRCFYGSGLTSLEIPYGVKEIGSCAFANTPITALTVPSSINNFYGWEIQDMKSLYNLYWNVPYNRRQNVSTNYFSNIPSNMRLYVPVGQVEQYKNDTQWSRFKNNTQAGAYDFSYYDSTGLFIGVFTVTKARSITDYGEVKYVYHPNNNTTKAQMGYTVRDRYSRPYTITNFSDSCFASAQSLTSVVFNPSWIGKITSIPRYAFYNTTKLTSFPFTDPHLSNCGRIGDAAFFGSAITGVVNLIHDPYACAVGVRAFYNCPGITELYCLGYNLYEDAFGGTTYNGGFACYVQNYNLALAINRINSWGTSGASSAAGRTYPFFYSDRTVDIISMPSGVTNPVAAMLPNLTEGPTLQFYKVTGYRAQQTRQTLGHEFTTTKVNAGRSMAAGDAFLVTGIEPGKFYRMGKPSVNVTPDADNLLVANPLATGYTVTPENSNYYYLFNYDKLRFEQQWFDFSVRPGGAFLKDPNKLTGDWTNNSSYDYNPEVDALSYNLRIGSTRVNLTNYPNITDASVKSGKVSYSPGTNTLTLNNATIEVTANGLWYSPITSMIPGLTINLKGVNKLNTYNSSSGFYTAYPALNIEESDGVTITGGGSIKLGGNGNNSKLMWVNTGSGKDEVMLTIKDCIFEGIPFADDYEECMTIDHATVRGTYYNMGNKTILKNCYISKPAGGYFNQWGDLVSADGSANWSEYEILPLGLTGDVNNDGKVDVSDVTELVNMILGIIETNVSCADIDGNGDVNVSDVTALVNIILNM